MEPKAGKGLPQYRDDACHATGVYIAPNGRIDSLGFFLALELELAIGLSQLLGVGLHLEPTVRKRVGLLDPVLAQRVETRQVHPSTDEKSTDHTDHACRCQMPVRNTKLTADMEQFHLEPWDDEKDGGENQKAGEHGEEITLCLKEDHSPENRNDHHQLRRKVESGRCTALRSNLGGHKTDAQDHGEKNKHGNHGKCDPAGPEPHAGKGQRNGQ